MTLRQTVRVPFGVVGMICEARPNVTADIFSLSYEDGQRLRAEGRRRRPPLQRSHRRPAARGAAQRRRRPERAFTLLPAGHAAAGALLNAVGYVDVVIPRGGAGLIRFVRENARVPGDRDRGRHRPHLLRPRRRSRRKAAPWSATPRRGASASATPSTASSSTANGSRDLRGTVRPDGRRTRHGLRRRGGVRRTRRPLPRVPAPPRRGGALRDRIPRLQAGRADRRLPRRSSGAHRPLLLAPQRSHRHRKRRDGHGSSPGGSMRRASTSTSRRPSPTAASSGSAPRSAFRPRNSTPAARWGCPNSRPTNT